MIEALAIVLILAFLPAAFATIGAAYVAITDMVFAIQDRALELLVPIVGGILMIVVFVSITSYLF